MSNAGKNRRAEEQFTPAQRAKMLWLVENGYGIEAVCEVYGLTEDAAEEYLTDQRAARRRQKAALTDWSKEYAAWTCVQA